jgi:phosphoribosyl-ATP pyrophosphohydrolase
MTSHILDKLYSVLQERKNATAEKSYVSSLYAGGSQKIAEKILEEAQEVIDEALALDSAPNDPTLQKNIRNEAADLLFHVMVMLSHHNVPPNDVFKILEKRFGTSGHDEKASRSQ